MEWKSGDEAVQALGGADVPALDVARVRDGASLDHVRHVALREHLHGQVVLLIRLRARPFASIFSLMDDAPFSTTPCVPPEMYLTCCRS